MLVLPMITHLKVEHYALFPGRAPGEGVDKQLPPGVTLIAGINGLGKTTLLNVLLRLLTGPYDLTGAGLGQLGSTLPDRPARLNPQMMRYFGQRVADNAKNASATLDIRFGKSHCIIRRRLNSLQLLSASVDGQELVRPGARSEEIERSYQEVICRLMELSSFVDVLLVLHYIVFFPEGRPGALWDTNAQRQLLRAIFVPGPSAAAISEAERQVGSADSYARNVSAVLFQQNKVLEEVRKAQATAPGLRARLASHQSLLDASVKRRSALDERRETIEAERRAAELDYERAKIGRADADRAVERLKFQALDRMFPKLPDAARLTVLTLLSNSECLVCGAHAEAARASIEAELEKGACPVCHSPPEDQENVVPTFQVETSRVDKARQRAEQATAEEEARLEDLTRLDGEYDDLLLAIKTVSTEISNFQIELKSIKALMPLPSEEIQGLAKQVEELERTLQGANGRREERARELLAALSPVQEAAEQRSDALVRAFERYAKSLLADEATLVRDTARAEIAQQKARFVVPAFFAEMSSAARPGLTRRRSTGDVSESQQEVIDLAFRFALIEAAGRSGASTLVMETPEASLDELAMERVGRALHAFANEGANRLVATSNLTNAGMIAWLFGGVASDEREMKAREERTLNLLLVGAKNRALLNDTEGRYPRLLTTALRGPK